MNIMHRNWRTLTRVSRVKNSELTPTKMYKSQNLNTEYNNSRHNRHGDEVFRVLQEILINALGGPQI